LATSAGATRPRSGRLAALLLLPAAILVAALLLALRLRIEPPTLPRYAVVDAGSVRLRVGDSLAIDLAPVGQVTGAVGLRAFVVRDGDARPFEPKVLVDKDGTMHLRGEVGALFAGAPRGDCQLAFAVGRPETLPSSAAEVLRRHGGGDAGAAAWWLVTVSARLEG
jgi:hypothetical protein